MITDFRDNIWKLDDPALTHIGLPYKNKVVPICSCKNGKIIPWETLKKMEVSKATDEVICIRCSRVIAAYYHKIENFWSRREHDSYDDQDMMSGFAYSVNDVSFGPLFDLGYRTTRSIIRSTSNELLQHKKITKGLLRAVVQFMRHLNYIPRDASEDSWTGWVGLSQLTIMDKRTVTKNYTARKRALGNTSRKRRS